MSELASVMCVEDDPDLQDVIALALEDVGKLSVTVCGSGEEALAQVATVAPDLILLDVMMPGMDGMATLEALRAMPSAAEIPVVFMTAKVQPDEIAAYRAAGAAGTLSKPFDPLTLADELRALYRVATGNAG